MPQQDNRPAVYLEGDNVIYRASAIGGCLAALWAARNNMDRRPIPSIVKRGMDEGTDLEPIILDLLFDKHGFTFADGSQSIVELNVGAWNGKTLIVRGKVDEIGCPAEEGMVNSLQKHRPIDVKAFTNDDVEKFRSKGFSAFPKYGWQQSVYGIGYGTDSFYMPIFNKGTWEIEDWSLAPHGVIHSREDIRDRIMLVEEAFESGVMPTDCPADFACQYPYLHDQTLRGQIPEAAILLARTAIKLREKIKVFESAKKTIDQALQPHLTLDDAYELDGWSIKHFKNPDKFNTAAAKELLRQSDIDIDNDPMFKIPGVGSQVRFSPPKKGKDGG